jgi:hypothetical protein
VVATDISAGQIHHATQHPRIEYRVVASEQSGLEGESVDLVMIAFVGTWSGTQDHIRKRGESPVPLVAEPLGRVWGEREGVRTIRWPL